MLRSIIEQTCTLPGLAGTFSLTICYLIYQLAHSISDPECCFNALLLYGPPGTGKTTMAESIARSAQARIYIYSASSMVTQMQGSGAESIINMFIEIDKALNSGEKVVLFVDEIDAFSRDRNGHAHEDQTNALLEFMQQVVKRKNNPRLIIIAATNKKELLDQAFLSRFKLVEIGLPNQEMCKQILTLHLNKYEYNPRLNIQEFSRQLNQLEMSGRDIERIVLEARMRSRMNGSPIILIAAMEDAMKEIIEQKKKILEEERKKIYKEQREEEVAELHARMTKQQYDESLRENINKRNQKLQEESIYRWIENKAMDITN